MEFVRWFRRKKRKKRKKSVEVSLENSVVPTPIAELEKAKQAALAHSQKAEAMAAEYKKAKEEAEMANRVKTDFLANMSHELRTPLNAILGYSEMLCEDAEDQKLKSYSDGLQKIIHSGKNLLSLINDILDMSTLETGKMRLYKEDYSLKVLAKELEKYMKPLVYKNENSFKINLNSTVDVIHTDISRLRQALINLLDNATKFTKNGKITLDIISLDGLVRFSVTDTGVGIPSAYQDKLFQSFSQADPSVTRKYGGMGLGLYLTKRVSELLGGEITVKSEEGKGSEFVLTLPQQGMTKAESPKIAKAAKRVKIAETVNVAETAVVYNDEAHTTFHGKSALIISFNPNEALLNEVRKMGFNVVHTRNGTMGLRLARKELPSLIILDISVLFSLGDALMDQWLTLSEIKSDPVLSKIPLVVMTKDMTEEGFGFVIGEVDFLTKPIDVNVMMRKIRQLVPEGAPTLLVVDDEPSAREIMSAAAKKAGWQSIEAVNGKEALQKMSKTLPSIILLDLMMPEMDGFTMISELQKNPEWHNIPVIIVSAKELSQGERSMLMQHTKGILQKGAYSRKELIEAISGQVKMGEQ